MFLLIPQKWRIYEQSNANFKFHYVSINSTDDYDYALEIHTFKFHYVSINSDSEDEEEIDDEKL